MVEHQLMFTAEIIMIERQYTRRVIISILVLLFYRHRLLAITMVSGEIMLIEVIFWLLM